MAVLGGQLGEGSKRVMRLSEGVYNASTLAAISIAAHESGHAIQHGEKYGLLSLRNTIAIPVGWASKLAWVFIIIRGLSF